MPDGRSAVLDRVMRPEMLKKHQFLSPYVLLSVLPSFSGGLQ